MISKARHLLSWPLVAFGVVALVLIASFVNIERERRELRWRAGFLPGNPRRGGELFFERGCGRCHAVSGVGGAIARDLARSERVSSRIGRWGPTPNDRWAEGSSELVDIVAAMWNHAPSMWKEMRAQDYPSPGLRPEEIADLVAFLFAAGYLDEQGDPARGEAVLAEKNCRGCHATGEGEAKVGPDLARWSSSANPILLAQLMWNHGPAMEEAMRQRGISWPHLEAREVVDLASYLRSIATEPRRPLPLPGDPVVGKTYFQDYCQSCHGAEGRGGTVGPDLGAGSGPRSLAGLAASLWNHTPAMGERMKELGASRPSFTEVEMAHLMSYLFALRYFEVAGSSVEGKAVFERSCAACHSGSGIGPSLRAMRGRADATSMAASLWNHGPRMYATLKERGLEWPTLRGEDMKNLIEYLRNPGSHGG